MQSGTLETSDTGDKATKATQATKAGSAGLGVRLFPLGQEWDEGTPGEECDERHP
jgi:hypothetical protein